MNFLKNLRSTLSHKSFNLFPPIAATAILLMTAAPFYQSPAYSAPKKAALTGTWGTVLGSQTYVRIRPSSSSPYVAKLARGTKAMVWAKYQGWYRVETSNHHFGWIHHDFVRVSSPSKIRELSGAKATDTSNKTGDTQVLYGSALQLRLYYAKYKSKGALLGLQQMGAPLVATSHERSQRVAEASGISPAGISTENILQELDVNNNYSVETIDTSKPAPTANRGGSPRDAITWAKNNGRLAMGESIANSALSYRGMPYIFGAQAPSRGFDCSGLVSFVLRKKGLNPPRTAAAQAKYGTGVARNQLQPGDLVFFKNTYKRGISHVGIYVGNNNFVHAANPRSGVTVSSLSSSYYANRYAGARRPPQK